MRTIKFRAWHKNKMYNVNTLGINQSGLHKGVCFAHKSSGNDFMPEDDDAVMFNEDTIFMQFTGLLDKNGLEIYEGDIVHVQYFDSRDFMGEDADYIDEVYYDTDCASFLIKRKIGADSLELDLGKTIEVIGNIHETHELLNKQS